MAGDWIKMRGNLWDDPRVGRLCDLTDVSESQVIGGLYWLWASADQHTENGFMPGLTLRQIDRKTATQGLGAALVEIGWIEDSPDGITILNFSEHNGTSAKRRCMDAQRKANDRKVSALEADTERTTADENGLVAELEKEKRREEEIPSSPSSKKTAASKSPACPDDVDSQVWADWLALRKAKRAPTSPTAITGARDEAGKAGMSFEAFLRVWCRRGTQGLEASWLKPEERNQGPPQETAYQRSMRNRVAEFAPAVVARAPAKKPETQLAEVIDVPARLLG